MPEGRRSRGERSRTAQLSVNELSVSDRIFQRKEQLQGRWRDVRLFALVDGLHYEEHLIERLEPRAGVFSLFEGGPEAALAHAGGWLIEPAAAGSLMQRDLLRLEQKAPAVCWFFSRFDVETLLPHLRRMLGLRLPDGREALLRFYDPRVLPSLLRVTHAGPKSNPFSFALEWHVWLDGQRVHPTGLVEDHGFPC